MAALVAAACALTLTLVAWAYTPGLHGPFLFDDFANLDALGASGRIDDAATFFRYLTSGTADPTGRPLALLTFLLDARDWPADPLPFKRTNLFLHLGNGLLLWWLLWRLARLAGENPRVAALSSWFAGSLWLAHPLWLSTTLYVVQREAMLPATFTLLALIALCRGWTLCLRGRRSGAWLAALAVLACTALAVASKANGILVPLLAWLIAAVWLRRTCPLQSTDGARAMRMATTWSMAVPAGIVIAYLLQAGIRGLQAGVIPERGWSIGQRLLTEPGVLLDYLALLWWPRATSPGLFNDTVVVSTGLLSPPSTLLALLALAVLVAAAVLSIRRAPAFALAVLFFLGGHLLESSVVGLELYFEHRNYLPAMLLFWPLGLVLARAAWLPRWARWVTAGVLPLALLLLTRFGAGMWGDADAQAGLWALRNPDSPRAQTYAATKEIDRGDHTGAVARLERAMRLHHDEPQLAMTLVEAQCGSGAVTRKAVNDAISSLRQSRTLGASAYAWLSGSGFKLSGHCNGYTEEDHAAMLDAYADNRFAADVAGRRQDLAMLRAKVALERRDPVTARAYIVDALAEDPRPGAVLSSAAEFGVSGYPCIGLGLLRQMSDRFVARPEWSASMAAVHQQVLWRQSYWQRENLALQRALRHDAPEGCAADAASPATGVAR